MLTSLHLLSSLVSIVKFHYLSIIHSQLCTPKCLVIIIIVIICEFIHDNIDFYYTKYFVCVYTFMGLNVSKLKEWYDTYTEKKNHNKSHKRVSFSLSNFLFIFFIRKITDNLAAFRLISKESNSHTEICARWSKFYFCCGKKGEIYTTTRRKKEKMNSRFCEG